jgi:hypothetical protein
MKRYEFRLWFANALMIVAALVLAVLLFLRLVPGVSSAAWLLPALTVLVSACALAFAAVEAVFLYRTWKAESPDAAIRDIAPPPETTPESEPDRSPTEQH